MGFKHILVPFEGGLLSEETLRMACQLAQDGNRITAVHVVSTPLHEPIGAEKLQLAAAEETLRRAKEIGLESKAAVDTELVKAHQVAQGIVEAADNLGADVILMSLRHAHTPEETMVLSHNASRILRHAPCPVLMVYEPKD
ncbi:MAG TPA: universal stress protein [Dehalococcoidia bacterium]|nr:universal stress protein [Dehalococcoidia bacterium]